MSFSSSSGSSSKTSQRLQILPISFANLKWGEGLVFEWYNRLSKSSPDATAIKTLQIRKDTSGVVPHRFVVLHMQDGKVHRLDRRPDLSGSDAADPARRVDLLRNTAVPTKDECAYNLDAKSMKEIEQTSNEIELFLDGKVDLLVVLSACFAISKDPSAQKYSLFANNCFFFSWTVLMVVSRVYLPYETPQQEQLLQRGGSYMRQAVTVVADEVAALTLGLTIEVATIVLNKVQAHAGPVVRQGLHPVTRLSWLLPMGIIRFFWKQVFYVRVRLGLRRQLKQHISDMLSKHATILCESGLRRYNVHRMMDGHLWLSELHTIVQLAVRSEIMQVINVWRDTCNVLSEGWIDPSTIAEEVSRPSLRSAFFGGPPQFSAILKAALHGGLRAAREVAEKEEREEGEARRQEIIQILEYDGTPDDLASMITKYDTETFPKYNEQMFDLVWDAARRGGLVSAKIVVEQTRDLMRRKQERDRMWTAIWEIWDDCWAEVHPIAKKRATDTLDKVVRLMVGVYVTVVIEELGDSESHYVLAKIQNFDPVTQEGRKSKWRQWWHPPFSERKMTNGTLQEFMKNMMKKDTLSGQLETINETMSRIWTEARKYSVIPVIDV